MLAFLVATPVLERVTATPGHGIVRGVVRSAAYVEVETFIIAVTARGVPFMPNGVALTERPSLGGWPASGTPVRLQRGGIEAGERSIIWPADRPPAWDPTLRPASDAGVDALHRRAIEILQARGIDARGDPATLPRALELSGLETAARGPGANAIALLLESVAARDGELAARAAELLLGRGSGLTPEGDDFLAGAAVVVAAFAEAAGWEATDRTRWLAAVHPPVLRRLTTPLSATLLELAIAGQIIEPVHGLLDLTDVGGRRWPTALRRLEGIGHSTGSAYAAAIGSAALFLTG
ncbi:MAG: DUF2877 domain-containing protein [Solirubrobacterales bacterium]|nr:DUF2877 domain-containing protein [Solirubrobacterales bacterium]MBV9715027.1 DUF2877 domain-containing protein [Solirubrobacterales bacterium]